MSAIPPADKSPFSQASAAATALSNTGGGFQQHDTAESLNNNAGSPPGSLPPPISPIVKEKPQPLSDDEAEESHFSSQTSEEEELKQKQDEDEDVNEKREPLDPPTRFIFDPCGPNTHDCTTVDVVTVPCPGGHPLKSWSRDGLLSRYFGAPSMRDAEVNQHASSTGHSHGSSSNGSEKAPPSWVRQGIRRDADKARIVLYEHPEIKEGVTLSNLADGLLEQLKRLRDVEDQERPLLFMGYSLGGLVVKMALAKAARDTRYQNIVRDCYGVGFFGK